MSRRSKFSRISIFFFLSAVAALAAGKQNPTPPGAAEVKVSSAVVPAGGTAQVQFSLTEPRPILSTGSSMGIGAMSVDGVAVWSPTGEAGGLGVLNHGVLSLAAIDPTGVLGTNVDYPFLTVTMDLPSAVHPGFALPVDWTNPWLNSFAGALSLTSKPGAVTVGGSISINGVYPGGGTHPGGTIIRILGAGFSRSTRLQTKVKYSAITITPTEIDLTLKDQTVMDTQSFQASNPDGSSVTYFAYLRGAPIHPPSRVFLNSVEPAFPVRTHAVATVGPIPALTPGQYIALALQNPTPGPLVVTLELKSGGQNAVASVLLPAATRVVDDLSALLGGVALHPGDQVRITSTSPVQMLGIIADEAAGAATPFLPTF